MSFNLVPGDLTPMPVTLRSNGVEVAVDGAAVVEFFWRKPDGTEVTVALTSVNRLLGQFQRDWVAGDTDLVGTHYGRVRVTEGGVPKTYPDDGSRIIWFVNPIYPAV